MLTSRGGLSIPLGLSCRYPLIRKLDGPQNLSGHFGGKKSLSPSRRAECCCLIVQYVSCLVLSKLIYILYVAWCLRRCGTSRTVPGSIPGGVTGFFSDIFPSDRTMSTKPLVKMSTKNIPGGKGGWCVRLTTSLLSRTECHEIWEPKPHGTLWATPDLLRDCFTFTFTIG